MTEQYSRPCIPLWDNSDIQMLPLRQQQQQQQQQLIQSKNVVASPSPTTPLSSSGAHPLVSSSPRKQLDKCNSMYNFNHSRSNSGSSPRELKRHHSATSQEFAAGRSASPLLRSYSPRGVQQQSQLQQQHQSISLYQQQMVASQQQQPSSPRYPKSRVKHSSLPGSSCNSPSVSPRTPNSRQHHHHSNGGDIYSTSCPSIPFHISWRRDRDGEDQSPLSPGRPRSVSDNPPPYIPRTHHHQTNIRPVNLDAVNLEANLLNQRASVELQRKMSVLQNLKSALNQPPPTPTSARGRLEHFPELN